MVRMTNKRFPRGEANVAARDVPTWEAAGWVASPSPKQRTEKRTNEGEKQ